jgi:hypothetical protein
MKELEFERLVSRLDEELSGEKVEGERLGDGRVHLTVVSTCEGLMQFGLFVLRAVNDDDELNGLALDERLTEVLAGVFVRGVVAGGGPLGDDCHSLTFTGGEREVTLLAAVIWAASLEEHRRMRER